MWTSFTFRNAPLLTGNLIGILVSLSLHGLVLFLMMYHWTPDREDRDTVKPRFIEARILQMKPPVAEPEQPKADAEAEREARRRAEEQERREQQAREEAERKRREAEQQELEREKELQRQRQLKQEAERKRQEELKREQELKRQQERERQEELARQRELQRQQELAEALARDEAMQAQREMEQQVGTYVDYMANLVASNWNRPPSSRRGMEVLLKLSLGSAGRVVGVEVAKSSGNAAFDRSAEQAVWKVEQFTRLKEMDPALYQNEFRQMYLLFRPEDLRK